MNFDNNLVFWLIYLISDKQTNKQTGKKHTDGAWQNLRDGALNWEGT